MMKVKHYCDDCGMEIERGQDACPDHPRADIISIATPEDPKAESTVLKRDPTTPNKGARK